MKWRGWAMVAMPGLILMMTAPACLKNNSSKETVQQSGGCVVIEFDVHQDMDLIRLSLIGEPPQFAIWLEDAVSHRLQTVFVTHRSGSGQWAGKVECPAALPRWFEVFREETNSTTLPTIDNPAPIAVTGATPQTEHFKASVVVERGSRWICWLEMNLAGDFNDAYPDHDKEKKYVDVHLSGQPPLIYRGEITAIPGEKIVPVLYGQSAPDRAPGGTIEPVSDDVTTARHIFKALGIRVAEGR